MALLVPSTQEIADNIIAQSEGAISQSVPFLPKAFIRVLAKALAGVVVILYKYAGFIFLQMFVAHATDEETVINGKRVRPLREWGRLVGVGDPLPAVRAEHVITVSVLNQTGTLKAGAQLLRAETSVVYTTIADVALNAASVAVTIRAASDPGGASGAGVVGNLEPGDQLSFANPLPNIARIATVDSTTLAGVDKETVDNYRARIIRRFQRKPQGGAYADYQQWGEEVPGVLNVYPYAGAPGEIDVYVETTSLPDGIATQPQRDAVLAAINLDLNGLASRRPVNAAVNVLSIVRSAFNLQVVGLAAADLPGTKTAIEEAVDEYLRSREPFIVGLSALPRTDRVTRAAVSGVVDTIVGAAGGTTSSVALFEGINPLDARSLIPGEKAKLGTVSYL